jgi:hypothetical protein
MNGQHQALTRSLLGVGPDQDAAAGADPGGRLVPPGRPLPPGPARYRRFR